MKTALAALAREEILQAAPDLSRRKVLVGMDGFVDTILHVVKQRHSAKQFERFHRMGDFAGCVAAASHLSANFELVPQMVKLGGNGPIMAGALAELGTQVTYTGALGRPPHPVFEDLVKKVEIFSIGEPGYTDALEFDDGKLLMGKLEGIHHIDWKQLVTVVPEEKLIQLFQRSQLVALVNWTMLSQMTPLLKKVLTRVGPKLKGAKRVLFFDLADPAKRPVADVEELIGLLRRFEKFFRVVLGLNLQESRQIGQVAGVKEPGDEPDEVLAHAVGLCRKLGIDSVVIHPSSFAVAATANGAADVVTGPYTARPKISTGAGDHFNAGFCTGLLMKAELPVCLQLGVATSGYYVRHARSPAFADLQRFLKTL